MRNFFIVAVAVLLGIASPALAGGSDNSNKNINDLTTEVQVLTSTVASLEANITANGGNVNFQRSAPSFSLPSPASGPCVGASGGFAISLPVGGGGASFGSIDDKCSGRELVRIGLGNPVTAPQAIHDWFAMEATQFNHDNVDPSPPPTTKKVASVAVTIDPKQQLSDASAGRIVDVQGKNG